MILFLVVDTKDRLMICAGGVRKKLDKLFEKVWNDKKRENNNSQGQRKKMHLTLSLSSIVLYI